MNEERDFENVQDRIARRSGTTENSERQELVDFRYSEMAERVENMVHHLQKLLQSDVPAPKRPKRHNSQLPNQNGLMYSFLSLILCVVILVFFFGTYTDSFHYAVDGIAVRLGYKNRQYGVVIDAGSTGSRVLAYEFHKSYLDGRLVLDRERFREVKPGLSSFVDNPKEGASKIALLLDEAKAFIPEPLWSNTPLVLKATAGLRLLDQNKADNLLNSVRELFEHSGFLVDENGVEIMDGTDEGIFSWFTVNFLLGRLSSGSTVAALDLGGGSTQVTFAPKDPRQNPNFENYMHRVPVGQGEVEVFTNSYLNLGLMAVRHAVFTHGYNKNETKVASECVNPIVKNKIWKYANVEYAVSGKDNVKSTIENPVVDFEVCLNSIKKRTLPLVNPKPITLNQLQVIAFSYFYDRAVETGMIELGDSGDITVADFYKTAKEICAIPNTDQPFMCLDVSYMALLLEEGYGLKPQTKIKLFKKIQGHEISWALGCAYNILTRLKATSAN
ncbi:Nucleoside diphosphate phosphatase ENTPD5 [Pseudolycoriella hygida]|uniref:nucleoside diphosphate phosphatase n=1 Tax=Pseudolycoriella hygida TaxID=35572 RepID=A0A9Q0S937_9DIPT|nr:Nucleoside diphosphate phosphatase ENTPD5 [Pseudolycoriella hygida]